MKNFNSLLVFLAFVSYADYVSAQQLKAEFAMARFDYPPQGSNMSKSFQERNAKLIDEPDFGPYLETYLKLKGGSLVWIETDSGLSSEVMVSYTVVKGKNVIYTDAYRLQGPKVRKGELMVDFIDQQRFFLKAGKYELVLKVKDLNNSNAEEVMVTQELTMESKKAFMPNPTMPVVSGGVAPALVFAQVSGVSVDAVYYISDIQLVDKFYPTVSQNMLSKVGYDLVPYTSNFFPRSEKTIDYYFEVYNTEKRISLFGDTSEYVITTHIENADDFRIVEGLARIMKVRGEEVVPVLQSMPIDRLPSGQYNLVIELKSRKNEVLDRNMFFFQRSNPELPSDSSLLAHSEDSLVEASFTVKYHRAEELEEYVRCLAPISTQKELQQAKLLLKGRGLSLMRRYLHDFWTVRYSDKAEAEWLKYLAEVKKVNINYSNNLTKGYDTDRGRVYLQYGPPNTIADSYFEPNTYPYEIWHYYKLENRNLNASDSNKRFVFANTSPGSNEFILLHSDADNEQNNARWHFDLQKRNEPNTDLDEEQGRSHNGSRALQYYNNPR